MPYGFPYEVQMDSINLWDAYGIHVESLWKLRKPPVTLMARLRNLNEVLNSFGIRIKSFQNPYGTPIEFSYGILMKSKWNPHEINVESTWNSYGKPLKALWHPFGMPSESLWNAYEIMEIT